MWSLVSPLKTRQVAVLLPPTEPCRSVLLLLLPTTRASLSPPASVLCGVWGVLRVGSVRLQWQDVLMQRSQIMPQPHLLHLSFEQQGAGCQAMETTQ